MLLGAELQQAGGRDHQLNQLQAGQELVAVRPRVPIVAVLAEHVHEDATAVFEVPGVVVKEAEGALEVLGVVHSELRQTLLQLDSAADPDGESGEVLVLRIAVEDELGRDEGQGLGLQPAEEPHGAVSPPCPARAGLVPELQDRGCGRVDHNIENGLHGFRASRLAGLTGFEGVPAKSVYTERSHTGLQIGLNFHHVLHGFSLVGHKFGHTWPLGHVSFFFGHTIQSRNREH